MLYHDRIDLTEGIDVTKSNNRKKYGLSRLFFLIVGSNFKILYVMVAMIWRCCVLR